MTKKESTVRRNGFRGGQLHEQEHVDDGGAARPKRNVVPAKGYNNRVVLMRRGGRVTDDRSLQHEYLDK